MIRRVGILFSAVALLFAPMPSQARQGVPVHSPAPTYENSSDGLLRLLEDILGASRSKDTAKEQALIRSLALPGDATWFEDEFGPAFGPRLAAAYRKAQPALSEEIQSVYDGDAQRGWINPKILRYVDAASANSPVDHFLNCMNEISPLYQTAFRGDRTSFQLGPDPDQPGRMKIVAGDLNGYYVYINASFRYIPQQVLMLLPAERPLRIQLPMSLMQSKVTNKVSWKYPDEAVKEHVKGKVVVQLVLDTNGNIKELTSLEGPPVLSDAVVQALRQWTFEPTTLDGELVEVETKVEVSFQ